MRTVIPTWKNLSPELKERYVRYLRLEGFTDAAIAEAFGTSKNAVVGYRHKYLPELTFSKAHISEGAREHLRKSLSQQSPSLEQVVKKGTVLTASIAETAVSEPKIPPQACQYPLSGGNSLHRIERCGKTAVTGENVCDTHLRILRRVAR